MINPVKMAGFKARGIAKKQRRSLLLIDNAVLISCIRFLVRRLSKESMAEGYLIWKSDLLREFPNLPRRYNRYFWAAMRLMKGSYHPEDGIPGIISREASFKLNKGWERHLWNATGLDLRDPGAWQAFCRLNPDLVIDPALRAYSEAHPILMRAKMSLSGYEQPFSHAKPTKSPDTPFTPPDIHPGPESPLPVSEHEMLMNKLRKVGAMGGRLTREQHEELPTEIEPSLKEEPNPELTNSQFWQEQMMRRLRGNQPNRPGF